MNHTAPQLEPMVTPAEMARLLSVKQKRTVIEMARRGDIPAPDIDTGKVIRWSRARVARWMESR